MINENWIYLGTAIGSAGALVYLRDTLRGTTQPNRVTWLLWAVAPLLAAAVEFNEGAGLRALPTFMVGFMPLLIFIGSFHNSAAVWKVRRMDYACGAVSVLGTIVWLITRNGVLAISAAMAADFLAGVPTLMKSWTHPQTETVHSYIGTVVSMIVLLLTVDQWDFDVVAFPSLFSVWPRRSRSSLVLSPVCDFGASTRAQSQPSPCRRRRDNAVAGRLVGS